MDTSQMRTWAECSESALEGNIRAVRARLGATRLMGVVKADAYGHGAAWAARILLREGAEYLAVATLDEAIALRGAGIAAPILIFGVTPPEFTAELLRYDLTQTVADLGTAREYAEIAEKLGGTLKCHIKIDTGMGRLGMTDAGDVYSLSALPKLDLEGVFTHFAVSDTPDGGEYTRRQLELFRELTEHTGARLRHAANSGAILRYPEAHLDMARAGILLYGYPRGAGVTPVMELKTRVSDVHTVRAGESVSYGRRYTAPSSRVVAVLPVGYADGLSRSLSGKFSVLINGKSAPQIGTICMDMCMVDVTDAPDVKRGDVATVFGREDGFTAQDMADLRGTIPYEVLCNVSARVPRVYVD